MICTFYEVPHGTACRDPNGRGSAGGDAVSALGGPKNTLEHSRMVQNGRVYPDHACVHKFLDFCNPYDVVCTFYKVPHGTGCRDPNGRGRPGGNAVIALGGPKNTSEHSRKIQNGCVYPDHTCVHEFLDFCNPYGVICTFYRVPMRQDPDIQMVGGGLEATL